MKRPVKKAVKKQVKKTVKKKVGKKTNTVPKPISQLSAKQQEARWRAEDDMRVLMQAEEIKADRKRVAAAKRMAQQKAKEAAAVASKIKG